MFHLLTDPTDRRRYVTRARHALKPGGPLIIATFGEHGPEQCSGLDVVRYSAEALVAEFGTAFREVQQIEETHETPWGSEQAFLYCQLALGPERCQ